MKYWKKANYMENEVVSMNKKEELDRENKTSPWSWNSLSQIQA